MANKGKALYEKAMDFEDQVRIIAEAIWGAKPGDCQPAHYSNDLVIRELDGLLRLKELTHLLMVTTSTKLDKAKSDIKKLNAAEKIEQKSAYAVAKWLITERKLNAEHIDYGRQNNVQVLTLEEFQRRFFDGRDYISKRRLYSFGSARNPRDNSIAFDDNTYVQLPIRITKITGSKAQGENRRVGALTDLSSLVGMLNDGKRIVLKAPFGSGKSLTTREIFNLLATQNSKSSGAPTPVVVNLREHWGQVYSDELLERHARAIGFTPKEDLVRAWRAGFITILLDGFDEVGTQAIGRLEDQQYMRESRRQALLGLKDLIGKAPQNTGLWICGRDHYFDSDQELEHALGLTGSSIIYAELDEFTEEGAAEFLSRNSIQQSLPSWLPRKPLLLAYLTQQDLLGEILTIDSSLGFGHSWDNFINKIVDREAELERAAMDPGTLRSVMERLAYKVRSRKSGLGPVTSSDLSDAYQDETQQIASDAVLAQLQRLPGLTQRDMEAGHRTFVDEDMLSALQGGAFYKEVLSISNFSERNVMHGLSDKAISMAAYLIRKNKGTYQTVISIIERLEASSSHNGETSQLVADSFMLALELAHYDEECLGIDFRGLTVNGADLNQLNFEDVSVKNIDFTNCLVREVILGREAIEYNIRFSSCIISKLSGISDESALPETVFENSCEILEYDSLGTNNAVVNSGMEPQLKALITILRKLYRQAGVGRKITAIKRGLGNPEVIAYTDPVLEILEQSNMVTRFNQVLHPVRKHAGRVDRILGAPGVSDDPVVKTVLELK